MSPSGTVTTSEAPRGSAFSNGSSRSIPKANASAEQFAEGACGYKQVSASCGHSKGQGKVCQRRGRKSATARLALSEQKRKLEQSCTQVEERKKKIQEEIDANKSTEEPIIPRKFPSLPSTFPISDLPKIASQCGASVRGRVRNALGFK